MLWALLVIPALAAPRLDDPFVARGADRRPSTSPVGERTVFEAGPSQPLSLGVFELRPSPAPSWRDPLDELVPPTHDATRDTLDLGWLIAPPAEGFALGPRVTAPIDPYDFSAPPPLVEVRTSTWTDPWRERELYESLWELRQKSGVNLRIGVGRGDCWWR